MSLHFLAIAANLIITSLASSTSQSSNNATGLTNITTGNPGECPHPTSYFSQLIDHSLGTTANNTFLQQYQVIADYFESGGPILFIQGDEAALSCGEGYSAFTYAQELGALLIVIEHRYFGISSPYGLNASESATWTINDMRSLTLDNILADSAVLVQDLRKVIPGANSSKVIALGGSYGGFLVPQLKIRYPDLFHGVIASGGVFTGLNTSPGPDTPVHYSDWVSNVYADLSFEAASIIRAGFDDVRALMKNGSFDQLQRSLNLCTTPDAANQTTMLVYAIYNSYESNSQFAQAAPFLGQHAHSLRYLVNETLAAKDPLAALNASISATLNFNDYQPCLAWYSGNNIVNQTDLFADSRQYTYMVCTYYAYPNTAQTNNTIFGAISEPPYTPDVTNVNDPQCKATFNISAKIGDLAYQQELGLSQQQLMNEERMLFVEAQYDWVSVLGLQSWAASADRNRSRWWFMAEASHTEDLVRGTSYDSQPLKDTRVAELSYMKTWLGM